MRTDRYRKRPRYQQERVPEIWIVDGDARLVERWRPDDTVPEVLREELIWHPDAAHPPLVIDLVAVFREAGVD
jgi:Uma2 family endonuclease